MITIGSLFSGIGGLELGLEWSLAEAGLVARVAWQVEIEPFPRAVLAKHWPDADRSVIDVRAAGSLPRVDLLCGGFPCQDVSGAGKGAGLSGARSGLWFAFLDVIRALRPALIVIENVASGLSRWLGRVCCALADAGYRTRARQISAADVGAPHRRERVFVVAYANSNAVRIEQGWEGRTGGPRATEPAKRGEALADADAERWGQGVRRVSDEAGLAEPHHVGELGNADCAGLPIGQGERSDQGAQRETAFRASGADRQAQCNVGRGAHGLSHGLDAHRWPAGRGEEPHAWEPPRTVGGRDPQRRHRLKALGNAVCPYQAREVGRWMIAEGIIGVAP